MIIDKLIDEAFSGVVSVQREGRILFQNSYGFADRANERRNQMDTRFGTASAGKAFVAVAILSLIEQGFLRLETSLSEVLSFDLKQIDPTITVRQLLNHTSGIPDYFDESIMDDYEELWKDLPSYNMRKSSDLIPLFIDKPMLYPKGERFQYNNTGYVVLGLIIEAITGQAFDAYLQEKIFEPCEMIDTGYFELDKLPARCAYSYIYDEDNDDYRTNIYSIEAKGSGAGGAFTTADDVRKFWTKLMNAEIIAKELVEAMITAQIPAGYYGYGLWLLNGKTPSFQGSDPGANFITSYDPDNELIITILSNMDYDVETLWQTINDAIT